VGCGVVFGRRRLELCGGRRRSCFWRLIVSEKPKREGRRDEHGVFEDGFRGTAGGVVVGVYLDH